MKRKKKLLVFGGTGFIGHHLLKRSVKENFLTTSVSTSRPTTLRKVKKVKYLVCDVRKFNNLKKKIKSDFDYVVNLSGYIQHTNKNTIIKTHLQGCKNIVNIFKNRNIKSFIQMGTCLEYGNLKSPQKEKAKCRPKTKYAKSKLKSNEFLKKMFNKNSFPFTSLRLYQAYGPNQKFDRLIPFIIKSCLKNKKFACSTGIQIRDFIYIEDLINLIFKIFKNKNARGKLYNVGSGKPVQVKKVIRSIVKILKSGQPQYGQIKMRKDEIKNLYPDIGKVKKEIKWYPQTSLSEGLRKTIINYKK